VASKVFQKLAGALQLDVAEHMPEFGESSSIDLSATNSSSASYDNWAADSPRPTYTAAESSSVEVVQPDPKVCL
jgi:hypothetical protein